MKPRKNIVFNIRKQVPKPGQRNPYLNDNCWLKMINLEYKVINLLDKKVRCVLQKNKNNISAGLQ